MDIVDRLLGKEITHSNTPYAEIAKEAAAEIERLRKERDGAPWSDVDDEHTPAIADTYASGAWKLNDQARQMVSNRHSKGALVWLVTWLLQRIETAERERNEARAAMAWQPIETAPHGEQVLLGWWTQDGHGGVNWDCEVHAATWGWRCGSISDMSQHGQATRWMPLPTPPEAT